MNSLVFVIKDIRKFSFRKDLNLSFSIDVFFWSVKMR